MGEAGKLEQAKVIARSGRCFIVTKGEEFLLFRSGYPRNVFVGKRSSEEGILALTKKATKCA